MSTYQAILNDLKSAMKNRDSDRSTVLRSLKAVLLEKEISLRTDGSSVELTEEMVVQVLMKAAKQRRDSLEQYQKAAREDLASTERYELEIIESYLPKMMDADEIKELVAATAQQTGAAGPSDMGKLMGALMPKVKGKADGTLVSSIVKDYLSR
jgi:uncharacterized protein YqeY